MKKRVNGVWLDEKPKVGERYLEYPNHINGICIKTFWMGDDKQNKVFVTSHSKRVITSAGIEILIKAEIRDANNALLSDFNDSFVMPVKRVGGSVEKSLLMTFINGECTRSVTFNQSGEYEVTKEMVNLHLDSELDFDGFNISVYE